MASLDVNESSASPPLGCADACCSETVTTEPLAVENDGCCGVEHAPQTTVNVACCSDSPTPQQPALKSASGLPATGCCGDVGTTAAAGCDEKCIETAAAIECEAACEKEANNPEKDGAWDSSCAEDTKVDKATKSGGCCDHELDHDEHSSDGHSKHNHTGHNSTLDSKHHIDHHVHSYTSGSSKGNKHQHDHGEDGRHLRKACSTHLHAAFEKYTSYLESARCICKSVLSSHVDTCCGKSTSPSASARKDRAAQSTAQSTSRDSPNKDSNTLSARRGMKQSSVPHGSSKSDDCHTHRFSDGCHPVLDEIVPAPGGVSTQVDPEKAAAREHVLLTVGGMDCSGCANKMTRSLNSMAGISNVQVVFVTGMAEFDLDSKVVAVEDVVRRAERATGLRCSRVITENQTLDVLMDVDAAKQFSYNTPLGVTACEALDKKTYRITFDPTIIGARSVLSSADGAGLASPGQDGAWSEGRLRLFKMSFTTHYCR